MRLSTLFLANFGFVFVLATGLCQTPNTSSNVERLADTRVAEVECAFPGSPVSAVAFSQDGLNVLGVNSEEVRVFDAGSGKLRSVVPGKGGQVSVFSPDSRRVAIASQYGQVGSEDLFVTEIASQKDLFRLNPLPPFDRKFPFRAAIYAVAIAPNGRLVATAGTRNQVGGRHGCPGGLVMLWDLETAKEIARQESSSSLGALAFSPDGSQLAIASDGVGGELPESGTVSLWDLKSNKLKLCFAVRDNVEPGDAATAVSSIAFSADGKHLVAAVSGARPARPAGLIPQGEDSAGVLQYELETGRLETVRAFQANWASLVAISPNNRWLVTAGGRNDKVVITDRLNGTVAKEFGFGSNLAQTLCFTTDSSRMAVAGSVDGKHGIIKIWSLPPAK